MHAIQHGARLTARAVNAPSSHRSDAAREVAAPCRVCFSQAALQGDGRSSGGRNGGETASHARGEPLQRRQRHRGAQSASVPALV